MPWTDTVHAVLSPDQADWVVQDVRAHWAGARVYLTTAAAGRQWRNGVGPVGAAEKLARRIDLAVHQAGGTDEDVRDILLALSGTHLLM